jgi:hypothetical protein
MMNGVFWLAVFGFLATACGIVWYAVRKHKERQAAEEARLADFLAATTGKARMVEALPAAAPAAAPPAAPMPAMPAASTPANGLAQQKLLFEAAHKAGEAGEPALAIQLYARLLARYPECGFVAQARAAAEIQKKKLGKA